MDVTVAISAERDQILAYVITQLTPRANVMDLKMIGAATGLASPAVALQHFGAQFAIRIRVQPKPRSPWSKISHWIPFASQIPFSGDP
jgi:hypothetical protein